MKKSIILTFTTDIVPKKNGKTAGIMKYGPRAGRAFIYSRAAAKESQKALSWEAKGQARGWKLTDKPVRVEALFKKRRGDCIGVMETVLDALEKIIYVNDRQVFDQRSRWDTRGIMKKGVTAEVSVTIL